MYKIDFTKPGRVHFIGVGGISMSGLAAVLVDRGFQVSGSDRGASELTEKLKGIGVKVSENQCAANITPDIDAVVYTAAIHPDNPEYAAAVAAGIPMLSRAQLLGQLMSNYQLPIAVAGTHGKTTATSMAAHILLAADKDPTISVGGMLPAINGNIRVGGDKVFLAEACEYTDSFLELFPKISIILNIDADHLDYFRDLLHIRNSFRKFAELLPEDGALIINDAIPGVEDITDGLKCRVIYYGDGPHHGYRAENVTFDTLARASFDLKYGDEPLGHYELKVPGQHNVGNALAVLALGHLLQLPAEAMRRGFLEFSGTARRFQVLGEVGGVTVVDDYAHHPTEIRATLTTAQLYPHKKLWCVFQPHTYSRTKALMDDFAAALSLADAVVLADIYAARETDNLGISSQTLRDKTAALGKDVYYFPSFDEIENFLLENCSPGDLLITMGAGDIVKVGHRLLGK